MSSFGFNNVLCGQITADPNVDKCDRKLRFYHAPIDACYRFKKQYFSNKKFKKYFSEDACQKPEKKIESFYSTLAALGQFLTLAS
jgi:hypothetical protein